MNTLPAERSLADKLGSNSDHVKFERSKSVKQRQLQPKDAAQIFDDKIPVKKKLKLLNRIATVKDDGTVEFEVPGDAEPETLGAQSHVPAVVDDDQLEEADPQCIPPLQIVILIVGTRGDVQPFVAIGKRLQVKDHAIELAKAMEYEDGVEGSVKAFFKQLRRKKQDSSVAEPTPSCFGCF
ncbi:hypothetical protein K1719_045948 [Acacia pycnantha]|nr:hypothetical protein K1719_045948 [Acacia pycnantha]